MENSDAGGTGMVRVRVPAVAGDVASRTGVESCPGMITFSCTLTTLSLPPPVQFSVNGRLTGVPGWRFVVIVIGAGRVASAANGPTAVVPLASVIE
jgi:hypothetical protein